MQADKARAALLESELQAKLDDARLQSDKERLALAKIMATKVRLQQCWSSCRRAAPGGRMAGRPQGRLEREEA